MFPRQTNIANYTTEKFTQLHNTQQIGERKLKWAILFAINFYLNKFIRFLLPYWLATQIELVTSNNSSMSIFPPNNALGTCRSQSTIFISSSLFFFSFQLSCLGKKSNSLGKNHFAIKIRNEWQKKRRERRQTTKIVFVTNELPLKITIAIYTH